MPPTATTKSSSRASRTSELASILLASLLMALDFSFDARKNRGTTVRATGDLAR
jgi:hypothetical protein